MDLDKYYRMYKLVKFTGYLAYRAGYVAGKYTRKKRR